MSKAGDQIIEEVKRHDDERQAKHDGPFMCDFCSVETTELAEYPCRDFTRRMIIRDKTAIITTCLCHTPVQIEKGDSVLDQVSHGSWMACPYCALAIDAHDKRTLAGIAQRHARTLFGPPEMPLEYFLGIHEPFWLHREEK